MGVVALKQACSKLNDVIRAFQEVGNGKGRCLHASTYVWHFLMCSAWIWYSSYPLMSIPPTPARMLGLVTIPQHHPFNMPCHHEDETGRE